MACASDISPAPVWTRLSWNLIRSPRDSTVCGCWVIFNSLSSTSDSDASGCTFPTAWRLLVLGAVSWQMIQRKMIESCIRTNDIHVVVQQFFGGKLSRRSYSKTLVALSAVKIFDCRMVFSKETGSQDVGQCELAEDCLCIWVLAAPAEAACTPRTEITPQCEFCNTD